MPPRRASRPRASSERLVRLSWLARAGCKVEVDSLCATDKRNKAVRARIVAGECSSERASWRELLGRRLSTSGSRPSALEPALSRGCMSASHIAQLEEGASARRELEAVRAGSRLLALLARRSRSRRSRSRFGAGSKRERCTARLRAPCASQALATAPPRLPCPLEPLSRLLGARRAARARTCARLLAVRRRLVRVVDEELLEGGSAGGILGGAVRARVEERRGRGRASGRLRRKGEKERRERGRDSVRLK